MNKVLKEIAKSAGMVKYPTGLGISENTIWGDANITKLAISSLKVFGSKLVNNTMTRIKLEKSGKDEYSKGWMDAIAYATEQLNKDLSR